MTLPRTHCDGESCVVVLAHNKKEDCHNDRIPSPSLSFRAEGTVNNALTGSVCLSFFLSTTKRQSIKEHNIPMEQGWLTTVSFGH